MQQQNVTLGKQNVVKLNLPMEKDKIFKKQRSKVPIHLKNPKTTRCFKKRHNCTCKQRTIIYRRNIYKPSNYFTEKRIIKKSIRRTILE